MARGWGWGKDIDYEYMREKYHYIFIVVESTWVAKFAKNPSIVLLKTSINNKEKKCKNNFLQYDSKLINRIGIWTSTVWH